MCFPDTSFFPASSPHGEMKPWALLTSIAKPKAAPGEKASCPLLRGTSWDAGGRAGAGGLQEAVFFFFYCICLWLMLSTDSVNFSGIAAAPLLSASCCPHGEGLELALFPYHQLVCDCPLQAELLLTSSQH